MAATSVFLSHSRLMKKCPSPVTKSHHHSSTLPSHLKHQQNHLFAFPKPSRTIPRSISISGSRPRQITCGKARYTRRKKSYLKETADEIIEEWKEWATSLPVLKWHERFEVEKMLSPMGIAKFAVYLSLAICSVKLLTNAYAWMYFTWFLVVWPYPVSVLLGIASLAIADRRSKRKASGWEQFIMVTGALTWLIIVPHAYLNSFIEGVPLNLFFVYFAYFLINFYLRKTVYGSVEAPSEYQIEWMRKNSVSKIVQIGFLVSMFVGHWAGAYESPVLKAGGGNIINNILGGLVMFNAMVLHYFGSYFFLKYSNGQFKPSGVVTFGPYRWMRHPVYASNMFFLVGSFIALRAYFSSCFVFVVSILYYNQKSKLEEDIMVEAFGEKYIKYRTRVRQKYLPFIY